MWTYGTFAPVYNQYAWSNLTNTVWVEQPVGTGFSQGTPTATNELEVAAQFLGWFKNFVDTFGLHGRKVYIAGESYAGYYVPYIADGKLACGILHGVILIISTSNVQRLRLYLLQHPVYHDQ